MANYNLGEARGKIILETDFSSLKDGQQALDRAKGSAEATASSTTAAWGKVGTAATVAGASVVAGFAVAVAAAGNFEFQMSAIQAVSGATAEEMDLIREAALRIGKDTAFSASEAANAMEELSKAGISTTDILGGAADAIVALAAAGGVDLPTAATIAANAMNQFNLAADDLVGVTDTIAGAANASAIDMNQFAMSMGQVGAVANLVGLSFDDTALAIAAMGNAGIVGSDAGTSLKTMLMNLQPSTEEASDLMRELGLITADGANQFYTAEGSLKSMAEISDILATSLTGMTDAQKQATLTTLFGTDAVRGAAIVAETGAAGFTKLSEAMGATSAAEVAATRMDNIKGSMDELFGSIETLSITIGSVLLPTIRQLVDNLTEAFNWFQNLDSGTQGLIVGAVGVAGALLLIFGLTVKLVQGLAATRAAILAITGATGLWTAATTASGASQGASLATMIAARAAAVAGAIATGVVTAATAVATAAQWAWNAALLANPIGLIIAAIVALVAGLIWFFTQTEMGQQMWSAFMSFLQEAWTNIASFFTTVWNGIVDVATTVWNGIMAVVGAVVDWFMAYVYPVIAAVVGFIIAYYTTLWNVAVMVFQGIMAVVGAVVDWFMAYVYPMIAAVVNFIVALWNFLMLGTMLVWNQIVTFMTDVVNNVIDFMTTIFTEFGNFWRDIWNAVSSFVMDIWNAIMAFLIPIFVQIFATVQTVFNNVRSFIETVFNAVRDFIVTVWNTISNAVSTAVNTVWGFISGTWGQIVSFVTDVFNRVYNAIKDPIDRAIKFVGTIKDTIMGFMTGAGDWLYNAGRSIIEGFINGLQDMFSGVTDFFNNLTNMIPEVKGPPARDKILLEENGRLIMQSLVNGLGDGVGDVLGMLGGLNATIPATLTQELNASVNGGEGLRPIIIDFDYHAAEGDTLTEADVMDMLGHATELVREEL